MRYLCAKMKAKLYISKALFVAILVLAIQAVYAAFSLTGIADEKARGSKYSLKNLSSLSHKGLSFSSLKPSLQYKGMQQSYIYPYKFKVKTSKFKTPAPQR
jgi:hypothetical protein